MSVSTPVAFFIFNRPDTTARVFDEIRRAEPPKLLVVADGPRPDRAGEAEQCQAARAIIKKVDWPCEILTNYSDVNLGCKQRISSGLNWVFENVDSAIILEDDCLPHPSFFSFCEKLLDKYRDDERIMMIGGTNYLLDKLDIRESYCFSRYFAIWGWASWRRAWKNYDIAMDDWPLLKKQGQLNSFYIQPFMRKFATTMFDGAYHNRIDTWDIQWLYTCLFQNGLSIIPKVNLISNIGLTGTHTSSETSNHCFPVYDLDADNLAHPDKVFPCAAYDLVFFEKKMKNGPLSYIKRGKRFLKKLLGLVHS